MGILKAFIDLLLLPFLAGFSERLVGDILNKSSVANGVSAAGLSLAESPLADEFGGNAGQGRSEDDPLGLRLSPAGAPHIVSVELVRLVQEKLGLSQSGLFTEETRKALMEFQQDKKLQEFLGKIGPESMRLFLE